jgi:hypothetical protein
MLYHDNAPCHKAISMNEFLTKKGIPVVLQALYSPDLSLCDFFLFLKLKFRLKGRHFFHMKNSSTAIRSASNISSGVWLSKGTTLKGIMLNCSSVFNKKFYSTSLITF